MQKQLVLLGRRTQEVPLLLLAMLVSLLEALHVAIEGGTTGVLVLESRRKLPLEDLGHLIDHLCQKSLHNLEWHARKEVTHRRIMPMAID
jgi:hypothetical protein